MVYADILAGSCFSGASYIYLSKYHYTFIVRATGDLLPTFWAGPLHMQDSVRPGKAAAARGFFQGEIKTAHQFFIFMVVILSTRVTDKQQISSATDEIAHLGLIGLMHRWQRW